MSDNEIRVTGTGNGSSARLVDAFGDELRKSGVNCKGYGILFKYPMLDPALTIEAKGIYCYICSYAGSDSTAFPGRDKIRGDLRMCKDAYYKHYQLLLDNDYIRVEQKNLGGNARGFLKNIYEIVERPAKFAGAPQNPNHAPVYAKICGGGLHQAGFGYIPRAVMLDKRLSVKARALYGYYRSFSGAGDAACPEKKDLLYHLGISAKLYERLMAELTALNYVTVLQRRVNGRLSVNDIHINTTPDLTAAGEKGTVKVPSGNGYLTAAGQKQDTQMKDTQKQDAQKQDTQIRDANQKTNGNKNNVSQYQSYYQQPLSAPGREEGGAETPYFFSVEETLLERGTLPEEWLGQRARLSKAVEYLADGAEAENGSSLRLFMEALTDMLSAGRPMSITGEQVRAEDVYARLIRYISPDGPDGGPRFFDLPELAAEAYEEACARSRVKNPLAYCKACLWTVLKTGDAGVRAQVAYDLSSR